jgi:hypothetical protein
MLVIHYNETPQEKCVCLLSYEVNVAARTQGDHDEVLSVAFCYTLRQA